MRPYFQAFFALVAFVFSFTNCVPPEDRVDLSIQIDLKDPATQRLFEFQDRRQRDSLLRYLSHESPTFRYVAARAFGSLRDSAALGELAKLLRDPSDDVRAAAAFAIGQIGSKKGEPILVEGFAKKDSLLNFRLGNAAILEAIGRCGNLESLRNLASISTYEPTDTLLLEGQALGIYRFALRKMTLPEGTARMVGLATGEKWPAEARLVAANYLKRAAEIVFDTAQTAAIVAAFQREKNAEIRMSLAAGLGKTTSPRAFSALVEGLRTEPDSRAKCLIINALWKFEPDTVRVLMAEAVRDRDAQVAISAANYFLEKGRQIDADWFWRISKDAPLNPIAEALLFQASNRWLGAGRPETRDDINYAMKERFQQSKNPYEQAAWLAAMAEFGWNYRFIREKGYAHPNAAVRTAAATAIGEIAKKPNFYAFFGEGARTARNELSYYLHDAVQSGDAGMIAVAAEALVASPLDLKNAIDSAQMANLPVALQRLKLPQEIETYNALAKTVDYFLGLPPRADKKPDWQHPIDWTAFAGLSSRPKATVLTKKGSFSIELEGDAAPGSVANFIKLARQGFFDGKIFHRVVPNFVAQAGCPRGDGYGSLDYSIRTENSLLRYSGEGWVGMASAGADTEGTQWFVTHSAAPHLDGNYTIFGRVVSGMDAVLKLEMGDAIEKITVSN